jgi:hypothetical protein
VKDDDGDDYDDNDDNNDINMTKKALCLHYFVGELRSRYREKGSMEAAHLFVFIRSLHDRLYCLEYLA